MKKLLALVLILCMASSSMFSSILLAFISVFIFVSSCLIGVILYFLSGCFTLA